MTGFILGLIIAIAMKNVPVFHGYDSNDVKRIIFTDEQDKKYMLVPTQMEC